MYKPKLISNFKIFITLTIFLNLSSLWGFTLIIDPGHGGDDKGASQGSIYESQIALKVALKLASKFKYDIQTKVILTRKNEQTLSLKERVQYSQNEKADLYVSLHGNSSTDKRAKGAEFYFGNSNADIDIQYHSQPIDYIIKDLSHRGRLYQSQYLAAEVFSIWTSSPVSNPRAIKQAPFYVINKNNVPSILVEFGFITNAKESLELLKDENQNLIAQNLYQAIKEFQKNSK